MVTCIQVPCWATHPKEYLIVDSPEKGDQSVTGSSDCRQQSALPCLLEEFPVERTRCRVESAWVDENLTTCSRTRPLGIGIGDDPEVRTFSCTNRGQFGEPHVITYPQADASKLYRIRRERHDNRETGQGGCLPVSKC